MWNFIIIVIFICFLANSGLSSCRNKSLTSFIWKLITRNYSLINVFYDSFSVRYNIVIIKIWINSAVGKYFFTPENYHSICNFLYYRNKLYKRLLIISTFRIHSTLILSIILNDSNNFTKYLLENWQARVRAAGIVKFM